MVSLIESSVWVDYFRPHTPGNIREMARNAIAHPDAALCEPVVFELLRAAHKKERSMIEAHFSTMPVLSTPVSMWQEARHLGRACDDRGWILGSLDLLIAVICLHHGVTLVTFDTHFASLAKVCPLKVQLLSRKV